MTWLELLDDAVKIGFGALGGWLIAKETRSHEFEKERRRRKQDCLERVIEDLDEHQASMTEVSTETFAARQMTSEKTAKAHGWGKAEKDQAQLSTMKSLFDAKERNAAVLTKLNRSHGKLLVFGFRDCADALQHYHGVALSFRMTLNEVRDGTKSVDDWAAGSKELLAAAEAFRESITKVFAAL